MLTPTEIRTIARARLQDAATLLRARRCDGAIYLCGYAVELVLKARICDTLNWSGYPSTKAEFQQYQSFKTHDLDILLHLSGSESEIKKVHLAEWSAVAKWDPEARYKPIGSASVKDATLMIVSARKLMRAL